MNTSTSVRLLKPEEIDELRSLLGVFGAAFEDKETYVERQPSDNYLHRLLSSDTFLCIAAFSGKKVVGGLAGYILNKFERARSEFYIYDLAVDAAYRRLGIATALISELQRAAAERAIYVTFVQADYGDEPAIALYAKLGVREDVIHFDIAAPKGGA